MQKDAKALITVLRNKLTSNLSIEDKHLWLHEKGLDMQHNNDFFFIKTNLKGHHSEFSQLCEMGVIFKKHHHIGYLGKPIYSHTVKEAKELKDFIWNDETVFIEKIAGVVVYMSWDPEEKKWIYSSANKLKSPYTDLVKSILICEEAGEHVYTYQLSLSEQGKNSGLFLTSVFSNKSCKEEPWSLVREFALRMRIKNPKAYLFEGFEKLEQKDLPLYAQDVRGNKILLKSLE
jgi:hypothetical protein